MKCVICNREFRGHGNNAEPVKEGRCCDKCNADVVVPVRMMRWRAAEKVGAVTKTNEPHPPLRAPSPEGKANNASGFTTEGKANIGIGFATEGKANIGIGSPSGGRQWVDPETGKVWDYLE